MASCGSTCGAKSEKVCVLGAGVIGLATAQELRRRITMLGDPRVTCHNGDVIEVALVHCTDLQFKSEVLKTQPLYLVCVSSRCKLTVDV